MEIDRRKKKKIGQWCLIGAWSMVGAAMIYVSGWVGAMVALFMTLLYFGLLWY